MCAYTLEDHIGQMILVGFRGTSVEPGSAIDRAIRECRIGGVWLTDADTPMGRAPGNVASPPQMQKLCRELQDASRIPLVISIDGEGGQVIRLKPEYGFPETTSAQDMGERDDLDFTRARSAEIARILRDAGINVNFAPVVDLNKNPDNRALGRKRRCFGIDPHKVTRHALAFIEEQQRVGLGTVLKHFPGHGSALDDSHLGVVDVTATWGPEELEPYRRLIEAGMVEAVMTAHVFLRSFDPQHPATMSKSILSGLLRGKLGFEGVIITDDFNMGAIHGQYGFEDSVLESVEAGADMILNGNVMAYDEHIAERMRQALMNLVRTSRLSPERIRESFERIMDWKKKLGLV